MGISRPAAVVTTACGLAAAVVGWAARAVPATAAAATAPPPASRPAARPVAASAPAKFEPPDGSVYHGACLTGYWSPAEFDKNLARFRADTGTAGRPLVLHSWFAHAQEHGKWRTWTWISPTPDGGTSAGEARGTAELSRRHGMVPLIAWAWMNYGDEPHSPRLQDLTAGRYDWYLDDWVTGVKAFKDPVFIRLSHEMDGDWYPYSEGYKADPARNSAADYLAYWRYVVDRFRAAGVTNVAWVWCVNGDRSGGKDWPDYYPGDAYVDWLGIDVYSARNPKPVLAEFAAMYGQTGKPIMIPEGGTGPEQSKWNKGFRGNAAWVDELFDAIEATPKVKALCWFQYGPAWDLERDADQLAAYRRRVQSPRYAGTFVSAPGR